MAQRLRHGLYSRMRAGGRVVLNKLSEQIRDCLKHAEECARDAKAQNIPDCAMTFLQLE
jgi:hypothetical protein